MATYLPTIDGKYAVQFFAGGVVALDLDEPEDHDGDLGGIEPVRQFAAQLSQEFGLGLYWLYQTGHGFHIIYQCQLESFDVAMKVIAKATTRPGWHECWGHAQMTADQKAVALRVGCKPGRPFDIGAVPGNPPASICLHVQQHEDLLACKLKAVIRSPMLRDHLRQQETAA